jgi:hypothetical protein
VPRITSAYSLAGGFVDVVELTPAQFRDHGERLFEVQPIRALRVCIRPPIDDVLKQLVAIPYTCRLRALEFHGEPHERTELDLGSLWGGTLDRLDELVLSNVSLLLEPAALDELLRSHSLYRLRFERCTDEHLVAEIVGRLLALPDAHPFRGDAAGSRTALGCALPRSS